MIILILYLIIILLIYFLVACIFFSNIIINIEKCDISYDSSYIEEWNIKEFKISVVFYIFKFIKVLTIKIFKNYIEIFNFRIKYNIENKIKNNKKLYEHLIDDIKIIRENKDEINVKYLKPSIANLDMDLSLGTKNPIITTFTIPTISFIISIILRNSNIIYNNEKYNYKITPKYINTNNLSLDVNTKLSFSTLRLILFLKDFKKIKNSV